MQTAYAKAYRNLWEHHWWWRSREAHVLGWVQRLRNVSRLDDFRILDIGCGDGLFFDRLERFGTVSGIEADGSIVSDSRHEAQIQVGVLGVDIFPTPDHDLVLMLDVLEHIDDDLGALESVRQTLRPGGCLFLTVPALPWLWSRHDVANDHARRYDRTSLGRALESAGFEVEAMRYFFVWTIGPLLLRRWIAPALNHDSKPYSVRIPPAPINLALSILSRCEHALGRLIPWPLGSSLLAVARPRGGSR